MPFNLPISSNPVSVWVVFCDAPGIWWLRPLRAGFRHCFIVMEFQRHDISIDPLLGSIEVMTHPRRRGKNLIHILKDAGLIPVMAQINQNATPHGPGFLCTCVTITKRILGLHAPLIQTPYALYRHLCATAAPPEFTQSFNTPDPTKGDLP